MELRHLRYFVAVAEELHFGRAARRLNISQPPLSQQVRALEAELGVTLLERSSRRVRLTEAGDVFLGRARRALEAADKAVSEARRAAGGELGRLTVGFMSSAMLPTFPPILRRFRDDRPDVEIAFVQMHSNEQLHAAAEGRIDIGFVDVPVAGRSLDVEGVALRIEPVWREVLVAAVPRDHSLAGRSRIGLAELASSAFVMMPRWPAAGLYDRAIQLCRAAGFSPTVVQEASQLPSVVTLVAAGTGVALVPACVADPWRDAIAFLRLHEPAHVDVAMIRRADNASPALSGLERAVRAEIADMPVDGPLSPIPLTDSGGQPAAAE